jgi:[ribosomal protein S5]-alanine N-acetyltransferase
VRLETPRLLLVPNTLELVKLRLQHDDFTVRLEGIGEVHFTPEFPGDALQFYPSMRDWLEAGNALSPGGIVIERQGLTAVGGVGCKGDPVNGVADIGYGFNPSVWNRGYATEIVTAFSDWLLTQPHVSSVTADTAVTNPASARVLEKSGFRMTGTGFDPDDGDLLRWTKP